VSVRRSVSCIVPAAAATLVMAAATFTAGTPATAAGRLPAAGEAATAKAGPTAPVVLFAADGMRQDRVAKYVRDGKMPAMGAMLEQGAFASGSGLRTQAPPNTGAGWYSLATGAWPSVTGSTNNTFHVNGQPFANRTAAFDPGVLQAETIAQAAERGGKKVAQIEWAGGRNASIDGPTVDFRSFFSGRGVVTNFRSATDDENFTRSFGLQYDSPDGFAGNAPYELADPRPATGWTGAPQSFSPAQEMRMRVLDGGTDKYGLDVYLYDSTDDATTNYDRALFAYDKNARDRKQADLRAGGTKDVKVELDGGPLDGRTAGYWLRVERLSPDLRKVRFFHTSVARANATWPSWPGVSDFSGDFEDFVAERMPSSVAADFAVIEAGIVSEGTYVRSGFYWEKLARAVTAYILETYEPDLVLAGYPVTDELQHQFLGLVSHRLPNGDRNPAYDDVQVNGTRDHRVTKRRAFIERAYTGADRFLSFVQSRLRGESTFVTSDHGFAPQFAAVDASSVLVELGLLDRPQTSNCRPASGETIGKAKACWAGGAVQIYLNLAGRDPAGGGFRQVAAADEASTVAAIKQAFLDVADPNDWTGDGNAEGWKVIDRAFSKAEARQIPNGPRGSNSTTDMAHPTRTGDVVAFAYPPYQFDAATPGTLVARSAFFGQHGYMPNLKNLEQNVNMRATFLAGGPAIRNTEATAMSTIDIAPTIAYLMRIPLPQHSQGRVRLDVLRDNATLSQLTIVGINDFHGQLDPTTMPIDGINVPVGGAATLATRIDEEIARLPHPGLLLSGGDNVGASPPNSALLEDMPAIDVENAWGMDATAYGNHEFDFGVDRLQAHQERARFPFLATNIVDSETGKRPSWVRPSRIFQTNGVKVAVIGAALETTPELVSAGATAGLKFLPAAPAIQAESERLREAGFPVQVVVIHEGTANGANAVGNQEAEPWDGPIVGITRDLAESTVDAVIAGHTHRVSNLMVGRILVTEGINAGATYSVLQLMVGREDVEWAGGATRVATTLGVTPREDVQAIVDDANEQTAELRNEVIGTQTDDVLRDPSRLSESEMGNMVADAMLEKYPGIDAALTNSGGLRADLVFSPPSAGEAPGEITWGEMFAVLPFGNRTVIETVTGAQLEAALVNGFSPVCDPSISTGRFPQVAGLQVTYHCSGTTAVVDSVARAPEGPDGPLTPVGATDTVRIVTNDFMFTGGDGYTALADGTDVQQPGDALLDVAIQWVTEHSPVAPDVEGRIVRE
jgi:2',3'-cyclic-nucleotide 2'-phosphodiesterase (5'-nucleotidase family)/predicted AlkP superfamily phosphohydrolase/phosphomutase